MTAPQAAAATAKSIRLIHAAMIAGLFLFALVAHFVLRRTLADSEDLPAVPLPVVMGVGLGACVVSLLLRKRVPQRATDESADLFWATAATPALITWSPLEAASLLAILAYARTGSPSAIGVAGVCVLLFVVLNPGYLERR